ncbi:hypothetical protein PPIS_b0588 [Pseudoalteromonas piscicida]|uniref:Uncharacterized protein n=1 Tax=Pseudoalteromonas piscicida TaxID=43662 RepID=A0ABN5CN87_PSEO7|nr:hypothetical protein PPIS_b0588 [Pseudoalteromonas piscicida]
MKQLLLRSVNTRVGGGLPTERFMLFNEFLMKKTSALASQKFNIKTTRTLCKTAPTR